MSPPPSVVISRLLNDLGYSYEHIVSRQKCFNSLGQSYGLTHMVFCGSKREGTTLTLENDFDVMSVLPSIQCFETEEGLQNSRASTKFMLTRSRNTAPGYALLKLISSQRSIWAEFVQYSLVALDGGYYLSSDDIKQQNTSFNTKSATSLSQNDFMIFTDSQGPSCPLTGLGGLLSVDRALAITCECPHLVSSWRNRHRPYNWPSRELINTVSSLDAHVVPVGYKGSPMQFLEWRICFTLGEIRLIESLNECQIKLIILLKMIAKEDLKPICQDMSTYIMKNLVLWLAESLPSVEFQECNLIKLLMKSLKLLKHCIHKRNFPSYMIESRNLFADRITDTQAVQLCQIIDTCLHEGPRMLLRCPKIRDGLALFRTHPATFIHISECRQLILSLYHQDLLSALRENGGRVGNTYTGETVVEELKKLSQRPLFQEIQMTYLDILLPDLHSLESRGVDIQQTFNFRCNYMLS